MLDHFTDTKVLPQLLKDGRWADFSGLGQDLAPVREDEQDFLEKRASERTRSSMPSHGSDNPLDNFSFDLFVINDLKVLIFAGLFDPHKHGSSFIRTPLL